MSPQSHGSAFNSLINVTSSLIISDLTKRFHVAPSPLERLSEHQSKVLRYVAISSSVVSIAAGLVGFYMLGAIDARRRVFRHHLIFFLIGYDFLKAVTLLFYPARVALVNHAYYNGNFCDIVGFFTAMAIEGADIAILSFAIHTALLIFCPNRKYKNGDKVEGGLFPYRYYVWVFSFVVPIIFASLAFIRNVGYQPLVSWCYLPERPKWYRLVLSWIPRYVIVITILCVYVGIYVHVIRQFNRILVIHEEINNKESHRLKLDKNFFKNFKYVITEYFKDHRFTMENHPRMNLKKRKSSKSNSQQDDADNSLEFDSMTDVDDNFGEKRKDDTVTSESGNDPTKLSNSLHQATMNSFEQRRIQIEKQMKSIFVYPISYILLWLAPFALQCIQYDYEIRHGPVYWLTAISAFMQPFNCTVDTIVFLYREQPWEYTVYNVSKKIKMKNGHLYANDHFNQYYGTHETWRKYFSWLPLYFVPDENYDFEADEPVVTNDGEDDEAMASKIINNQTHDFSNILGSNLNEDEFRAAPSSKAEVSANIGQYEDGCIAFKDTHGLSRNHPNDFAINPLSDHPNSPNQNQQQMRSDTLISTSDFYNMPHRMSSIRSSLPFFQYRKDSDHQGKEVGISLDIVESTNELQANYDKKKGFWSRITGGAAHAKETSTTVNTFVDMNDHDLDHEPSKNIFGDYKLEDISNSDQSNKDRHDNILKSPTNGHHLPSIAPHSRSNTLNRAFRRKSSSRKTPSLTSPISTTSPIINNGGETMVDDTDDSSLDFLDFLNRGPPA
ncbi:Gpr1 protein [Saccharomycopsis crataegensis]|uniref:Gpr1 protein n=1 Tax=Saccharomycopsis crataegensis TaxID=43959 RepID=A0AAV5QLV4_9ASCO|nr:Gpr1 protein [Saccharomycopsis crataegensis]